MFKPDTEFSESERRMLEKQPQVTFESIVSGEYMNNFESYCADQFPKRDIFRSLKAFFTTKILNQKDYNGLFMSEGHISKLDSKINPEMINHAAGKFKYIYEKYLEDTQSKVYFTVIPDKNYTLTAEKDYPSLDYNVFIEKCIEKIPFMQYINICDLLSADDYYKTDSHWRQENIRDIAQRIANTMETDISADYTQKTLDIPFYGVYAGQYPMKVKPDTIKYLTNNTLKKCKVTYYDNMGYSYKGNIYDLKKANENDPYELFLSGSQALIEIENMTAKTNKELVLFRDSYGSSLAPLLVSGYKKITLVDIRYIKSFALESYVNFDNCDVLFMYSTSLLNNSKSLN